MTENPVGNYYNKYQSSNPVERLLVGRFTREVLSAVTCLAPSTLLDAGCGEGVMTARIQEALPGCRTVAMDHGHELIGQVHRQLPAIRFLAGSITRLPFPGNSFDLVIATEVFEHLPDPGTALEEVARVSRRHVLLTVPWEPWWRILNCLRGSYLSSWGNTPGHLQHWSRSSFRAFTGRRLRLCRVKIVFPWIMAIAEIKK